MKINTIEKNIDTNPHIPNIDGSLAEIPFNPLK